MELRTRLGVRMNLPALAILAAALSLPACTSVSILPPPVADLRPCDISQETKLTAGQPGVIVGKKIVISTPIRLKEGDPNLVIVARDDLDVRANILFPTRMPTPHAKSVNITLVSLNGSVTIAKGITVGGGKAANGPAGNNRTPPGFGVQGANLKIYGLSIFAKGILIGNEGGDGGNYTFTGLSIYPAGSKGPLFAGIGGPGGNIGLCATEVIEIASATAGMGGVAGGLRSSWNVPGLTPPMVFGANGGPGGDVLIHGAKPKGPRVAVQFGQATGGKGGLGGLVNHAAFSGTGVLSRSGDSAWAMGGYGGTGGTVTFRHAVVGQMGPVTAGDGASGGPGIARGADGPNASVFWAIPGGSATAHGGHGGFPGARPDVPTQTGNVDGVKGKPGGGGTARAISGAGGNGHIAWPAGANSGTAIAIGGANGLGQKNPPPFASAGPIPAVGGTGGGRATAVDPGTP